MNYNALFGDSWGPKLQEQISPKKLKYIFDYLKDQSSQGKDIFPKPEKIFRCLKECPFDKTMVVFIGVNPYYEHRKWSDGLLFSSTLTKPLRPKVEGLIFAGVEDNYDKPMTTKESNLERWANQGVLLLPLDLTMEKGKKKAHLTLWGPFIAAVISALQKDCPGVIYVLLGQDALQVQDLIDPSRSDVVCLEHPSKSLILGRNWKHKSIFLYLDRVTNMIFNKKIDWYA